MKSTHFRMREPDRAGAGCGAGNSRRAAFGLLLLLALAVLFIPLSGLLPSEGGEAVDIQRRDADGNKILEDGLHPVLDFQALAGVCLSNKVVPSPAELPAAEQCEDEGAYRQAVRADDEIPEVKPGTAVGKGLEVEHAVAQRRGERQQEDANAADQAALFTVPAGQIADAGQDVLKHGKLGGERREHHEQEEQGAPEAAAAHVVEDSRHGIEQQRRAGVDFDAVGEAGREHDEAGHDGDKRVHQNDVDGFTHQGALLADVAAEDRHGTDADAQGEERLVHGADNDGAVDL